MYIILFYYCIAVPPKKPIIHDANGRKMVSVLGPYKIGEKLIATCISSSGKIIVGLRCGFEGRVTTSVEFESVPRKIFGPSDPVM